MLDMTPPLAITGRTKIVGPSRAPVDLDAWNAELVRRSHNCLSFALAAMGAGWSLAGDLAINHYAENRMRPPPPIWVGAALKRDGLTQIYADAVSPGRGHVISAFEKWDGWDFHVRYLSPCGTWFEKVGDLEACVCTQDALSHQNTAGEAYSFAGFFTIPDHGVAVFHPDTLHPIEDLRREAWRKSSSILRPYPAQTLHAAP